MRRIGRKLPLDGLALSVAAVALSTGTACHYVDPQCLAADLGISGSRAHGVVLSLDMNLPYKRYTEALHLAVNGAGGVVYAELWLGDVTACRRLSEDQMEGLARFWSSESLGRTMPRCGSGYAFSQRGDHRACRESWPSLLERWRAELPYASTYYGQSDEEGVSFNWDMESPLPDDLEQAFTGTLGLLCAEGPRLARNLRRSMPELAAKAGC